MIPAKSEVSVTSNLPGESRRMTIADGALAYIMKSIIDLYSDKELAVIRELSTNAADSHVMAGNSDPIEVTTPGPLSPYLVIADHGVGLSESEVYDLFGSIGASNKRTSNEVNGMMGYGSKSPLTYTNQFTMTATKDGRTAVVSISRDEDGVGRLTTVTAFDTTEPNGVEIKVPAKSGNTIDAKARKFYSYWKPGTVLLNGKEPEPLSNGMFVADRISVTRLRDQKNFTEVLPGSIRIFTGDRYANESVVVMGNVPYPAPALSAQACGLPHGYNVVAEVPIGSVEFAPSREALMDGRTTDETIAGIRASLKKELPRAIERQLSSAKTPREALQNARQWRQVLRYSTGSTDKLKWNGRELPTELAAPSTPGKNKWGGATTVYSGHIWGVNTWDTGRTRVGKFQHIDIDVILKDSSVFIENFTFADVTPTHKKKIRQWLDNNSAKFGATVTYAYLMDFPLPLREYVDPKQVVDWSVIQAEKLPKAPKTQSASSRLPGSYDTQVYSKGSDYPKTNYEVPGDKIDFTKPVFYHHGNVNSVYTEGTAMKNFTKDFTVICLPANRIAKFTRDNPKIEKIEDALKAKLDDFIKNLTDDQKKAMALRDSGSRDKYLALEKRMNAIKDPEVVERIRLAKINTDPLDAMRRNFRYTVHWPEFKLTGSPIKRYTLLARIPSYHYRDDLDEIVRYMNSEYAHRMAKKAA